MKYASDGSFPLTIVPGTSITGRYAADGSMNAVLASGTIPCGMHHPCGAVWITIVPNTTVGWYAPDGSLYAMTTSYGTALLSRFTSVGGTPTGDGGMKFNLNPGIDTGLLALLEDI